jgi:exodeoxyribonuclease VII small subunit
MTYESLFARMQEIVAALEAGELPLDHALALYEEGVAVAAACQRLLDGAVLRVQELQGGLPSQPGLRED